MNTCTICKQTQKEVRDAGCTNPRKGDPKCLWQIMKAIGIRRPIKKGE
jgi:hypothetical protein